MTSNSAEGGSFFDVDLSDLLNIGVDTYNKDRERSRVGSGNNQSQTSTPPNAPPPGVVAQPVYDLGLPPWAMTLLVVSGVVLAGAIAWKMVR